jgi:hypothetical protein
MARLPTVGADDGNWGTVLNSYLQAEHNADGTHGIFTGSVTDIVNTQSTVGATYTIPAPTVAGINYLTLTTSCTLTFPTAVAGQCFSIVVKQGGSGSYTLTYPATVKWQGGTSPTLTTTVGSIDMLGFLCVDGTNWFGFNSGTDMR